MVIWQNQFFGSFFRTLVMNQCWVLLWFWGQTRYIYHMTGGGQNLIDPPPKLQPRKYKSQRTGKELMVLKSKNWQRTNGSFIKPLVLFEGFETSEADGWLFFDSHLFPQIPWTGRFFGSDFSNTWSRRFFEKIKEPPIMVMNPETPPWWLPWSVPAQHW